MCASQDRSTWKPRMGLETKLKIIELWDTGKFSSLHELGRHLGLQRVQVSRILCTRMNYVEDRGRPIVVVGETARQAVRMQRARRA